MQYDVDNLCLLFVAYGGGHQALQYCGVDYSSNTVNAVNKVPPCNVPVIPNPMVYSV